MNVKTLSLRHNFLDAIPSDIGRKMNINKEFLKEVAFLDMAESNLVHCYRPASQTGEALPNQQPSSEQVNTLHYCLL